MAESRATIVASFRQAAKAIGLTPPTIREWVTDGKISPPPWTVKQLMDVRDRPNSPARKRGSRAAHGTLKRYQAGCSCDECRRAAREEVADREHSAGDLRFPNDKRTALLELLRNGVLYPQAVREVGVSSATVWGRCHWDPEWAAQFTGALEAHRPPDLPHGHLKAYRTGCRCKACRRVANHGLERSS